VAVRTVCIESTKKAVVELDRAASGSGKRTIDNEDFNVKEFDKDRLEEAKEVDGFNAY
jgi:hypothetical protein